MLTSFDRHFSARQRRHDGRFAQKARLLAVRLVLLVLEVSGLLKRLVAVSSARTEYLQSFVPGKMGRWFGHVFGHTRQADIATASDVHLWTAVDVGLRY